MTSTLETTASPARAEARPRLAPVHAVAGATVATFAVRLWLALQMHGPFMYHDEGSYVAVSRLLTGDAPELFGPRYAPGYGLLLTPAEALFGPVGVYRSGQVLNALAAALLVPVLYLVGRRIAGSSGWLAAGAAVVAANTAALFVVPSMLLPETLLTFVVSLTPLIVFRLWRSPRVLDAVVLGGLIGAAYALHTRGAALVGAVFVVVAIGAARRHLEPVAVGALLAAAAAVYAVARIVSTWATRELYPLGSFGKDAGSLVAVVEEPVAVAQTGIGHLWYLVFSTLGLGALGLIAAAILVFRERRALTPASAASGVVVLGVGAAALLSAVALHRIGLLGSDRADKAVYGRYLETWIPLLVVLAPAVARRWRLPAVAGTALFSGAAGVMLFVAYDGEVWNRPVAWHNVSALRFLDVTFDRLVVVRTAVALVVLLPLLFVPLLARRTRVGWAAPLAAVLVLNAVGGWDASQDWARSGTDFWRRSHVLGPIAEDLGERVAIDLDSGEAILYAYNFQFWHPDLDVDLFLDGLDLRVAPVRIAHATRPPLTQVAELLAVEPIGGWGLWIVDEDLEARLRADGVHFLTPPV